MRVPIPKVRRRWLIILAALAGCAVFAGLVSLGMSWARDRKAVELVRLLQDPDRRDRALYDLLKTNRYYEGYSRDGKQHPPETCRVNHVVVCPQKNGDPLYAVFKAEGFENNMGGGPGRAVGHVIVFDSKGRHLPYYGNYNLVRKTFRDINADGIVEHVESMRVVSHGREFYVLWVLPITPGGKPILAVQYGPNWSYKVQDDGRGACEIQLGPGTSTAGDIVPTVSYRWSMERQRYEGPPGGDNASYKRIDDTGELDALFGPARRGK